jgi:hypothetical protein
LECGNISNEISVRGIVCGGSLLIDWSSVVFCLKLSQCRLKSKGGSSYFIEILNYAIRVILKNALSAIKDVVAPDVDDDTLNAIVDVLGVEKTF